MLKVKNKFTGEISYVSKKEYKEALYGKGQEINKYKLDKEKILLFCIEPID